MLAEEWEEHSMPWTSNRCDGFRMGRGAIVLTAAPAEHHKHYVTENKSLKSNEWQHTQKPKNWFSISTPRPSRLRQKRRGFLVLWQKILLPGDTLAHDVCVRLLCAAHRARCVRTGTRRAVGHSCVKAYRHPREASTQGT